VLTGFINEIKSLDTLDLLESIVQSEKRRQAGENVCGNEHALLEEQMDAHEEMLDAAGFPYKFMAFPGYVTCGTLTVKDASPAVLDFFEWLRKDFDVVGDGVFFEIRVDYSNPDWTRALCDKFGDLKTKHPEFHALLTPRCHNSASSGEKE
jgi:hypothetical protein